jgi:hypothetical protein
MRTEPVMRRLHPRAGAIISWEPDYSPQVTIVKTTNNFSSSLGEPELSQDSLPETA